MKGGVKMKTKKRYTITVDEKLMEDYKSKLLKNGMLISRRIESLIREDEKKIKK